jgi:Pectate lyase superfamily protein
MSQMKWIKKYAMILLVPAYLQAQVRATDGVINVRDFGAIGDGKHDDYQAIQSAIDYAIQNPSVASSVRFPVANYRITHPLILELVRNNKRQYFTVRLFGDLPNKSASNNYLSRITCDFTNGFGIGIQYGRGITIENITLLGKYAFPYSINNFNIGTTLYSAWNDGSVTDKRYAPYAGIVIDPFCDSNSVTRADGYDQLRSFYLPGLGAGGTSGVNIKQCGIKQFEVGICLTPNPVTRNDEMINMDDDDIEAVKVAIAIGQDQSKEIHIDRLKCWSGTHTILDGINYGRGTGGGSVMMDGANIAGNVNQLFNVVTDRFPLGANNIYGESLFRIGSVVGNAGSYFTNFQISFLTGPGMPAADYLFYGGPATFAGGSLRYYNNNPTQRMNFSNAHILFRDLCLSTPPIVSNVYGYGLAAEPSPAFSNVYLYYSNWFGGMIGRDATYTIPYCFMNGIDPLYHSSHYLFKSAEEISYNISHTRDYEDIVQIGARNVFVDRKTFTAYFTGADPSRMRAGDYLLTGDQRKYYDLGDRPCPTSLIGRIQLIRGDTVYLDQVGLNMYSGKCNVWLSVIYYTQDGMVFNVKAGSNTMTKVQSVSFKRSTYSVGTRFTTAFFPRGSYVTAYDEAAQTLTMSAAAVATANDVSMVNGEPEITMTSTQPPGHWINHSYYKIYGLYPGLYRQGNQRWLIGSVLPYGDTTVHKFLMK